MSGIDIFAWVVLLVMIASIAEEHPSTQPSTLQGTPRDGTQRHGTLCG
jgi:hypothetical protein